MFFDKMASKWDTERKLSAPNLANSIELVWGKRKG